MKFKPFIKYCVAALLLIAFSAATAPLHKNNIVFWIAYAFAVISLGLQCVVYKISLEKGKDIRSKVYGFPLIHIGTIYLYLQIIISFVEMLLAEVMPSWLSVSINILVLVLFLIGLIMAESVRTEIIRQEDETKERIFKMELMKNKAQALFQSYSGPLSSEIKKLYESLKYSDPVSVSETNTLEEELLSKMDMIMVRVKEGNQEEASHLMADFQDILAERNVICKSNK